MGKGRIQLVFTVVSSEELNSFLRRCFSDLHVIPAAPEVVVSSWLLHQRQQKAEQPLSRQPSVTMTSIFPSTSVAEEQLNFAA